MHQFFAQCIPRFLLSLFPGRFGLLEQRPPLRRELKRPGTTRLGNNFQPALCSHSLDVAAECRGAGSRKAPPAARPQILSQHQDIELADFDTEVAESVVTDVRHNTTDESRLCGEATTIDTLVCRFRAYKNHSRSLYARTCCRCNMYVPSTASFTFSQ